MTPATSGGPIERCPGRWAGPLPTSVLINHSDMSIAAAQVGRPGQRPRAVSLPAHDPASAPERTSPPAQPGCWSDAIWRGHGAPLLIPLLICISGSAADGSRLSADHAHLTPRQIALTVRQTDRALPAGTERKSRPREAHQDRAPPLAERTHTPALPVL